MKIVKMAEQPAAKDLLDNLLNVPKGPYSTIVYNDDDKQEGEPSRFTFMTASKDAHLFLGKIGLCDQLLFAKYLFSEFDTTGPEPFVLEISNNRRVLVSKTILVDTNLCLSCLFILSPAS